MFQIQNPIHPLLWTDVTTPGVRLCLCGDGGDGGDGGGWGGGKETRVLAALMICAKLLILTLLGELTALQFLGRSSM